MAFRLFEKCCLLFYIAMRVKLRYCNILTRLEFHKWSFHSKFNIKTHNCKKTRGILSLHKGEDDEKFFEDAIKHIMEKFLRFFLFSRNIWILSKGIKEKISEERKSRRGFNLTVIKLEGIKKRSRGGNAWDVSRCMKKFDGVEKWRFGEFFECSEH